MAARDQAKAKAARASVRGELPDASLELQPLDLASLATVRQAAASILADHPRINILINPADRRRGAQHQLNLPLEHRPVFR
jgi:NAD(P)-dependent dehydrogenase (short-subunit alcohol dehydrogenase family)